MEEIARFVALELDFAREAESLERIRAAFRDDPDVRIPKLHADRCTPKLLVMEYLDGAPVHDLDRLRAEGVDLRALADRIARIYRRMIFEQGFFHGDPHPGNLLVLPDGRVGLVDFGLAKQLPPGFPRWSAAMFAAALRGDGPRALDAARRLGFELDGIDPAVFLRVLGLTFGAKVDIAEVPELANQLLRGRIPDDIALVIRTLVLLNGLSERLVPGERRISRQLLLGAETKLVVELSV